MKTCHVLLTILIGGSFAAGPAWAVRDPFWPIGYSPVSEKEPEPQAPKTKHAVASPKPNPITDDDWAKARQALPVNGITKSVRPNTNETRISAMINRQIYTVGDTVSFVYKDIQFQWRIESIKDGDINLAPLQAERIPPKTSDLKQQPQTNAANLN